MADTSPEFQAATERIKGLTSRPSNEALLSLYALYKQATEGDVSGSRPGFADLAGRAKFDAWRKLKGTSSEEAQQKYLALVDSMI
jgi:acyl-CoA-binding protein